MARDGELLFGAGGPVADAGGLEDLQMKFSRRAGDEWRLGWETYVSGSRLLFVFNDIWDDPLERLRVTWVVFPGLEFGVVVVGMGEQAGDAYGASAVLAGESRAGRSFGDSGALGFSAVNPGGFGRRGTIGVV